MARLRLTEVSPLRNRAITLPSHTDPWKQSELLLKENDMKKNMIYIGLTALTLSLGGGLILSQTVLAQTTQTAPTQRTDYAQVYLDQLAAALGVDVTKLKAALQTAGNATIDQALKNQDITRIQADRMRQALQNGGPGFFGRGMFGREDMNHGFGPGGQGGTPGMGMMGVRPGFDDSGFAAAAKALGMTAPDLTTQLRSGKTLSDVAKDKGVNAQTVKDAVLAALKTRLQQAVTAGRLSQAQADQILANAQQDPNFGLFPGWGMGH